MTDFSYNLSSKYLEQYRRYICHWPKNHQQALPRCTIRHSLFAYVDITKLYRTKTSEIFTNPAHVAVMPGAVNSIKQAGAEIDQTVILTPFEGQLMMVQNPGLANETTITIDGA